MTSTTKRYYTLGGTQVAVRDSAGGGSLNYLLGDQLGSTTTSVNASTGATQTQRFLPYGAPRSGSIAATDRGWIGQTKDNSTGLQYLNARYYDPAIGRFTAIDPLVDTRRVPSLDGYGYGYDNPTTLKDPSGLWIPVGVDQHSGSYDARRQPKIDVATGNETKIRLPGTKYVPIVKAKAAAPQISPFHVPEALLEQGANAASTVNSVSDMAKAGVLLHGVSGNSLAVSSLSRVGTSSAMLKIGLDCASVGIDTMECGASAAVTLA
ncbi:MAG: RHS repeat-associated core domain-containing protein [Tepidiformaceae bacterium]